MRHAEIRFGPGTRRERPTPREEPAFKLTPGADDGAELGIEELEPRLTPDVTKPCVPKRTAGWGC